LTSRGVSQAAKDKDCSELSAFENTQAQSVKESNKIMKDDIKMYKVMGNALLIGVFLSHCQVAQAGWSGILNGTGFGWASVKVTSGKDSNPTTGIRTYSISNVTGPSAAETTDLTYRATGPLPNDANSYTLAKIRGSAGYVWAANCRAGGADKSDAPGWTEPPVFPTSSAASTSLEVLGVSVENNACGAGVNRYTVTWHWSGTDAGTAQQIAFYNYTGSLPPTFDSDGRLCGGSLISGLGPNPAVVSGNFCGGEQTGFTINSECEECEEYEDPTCLPGFDDIESFSFCATPDQLANIYMVTHGVAQTRPCGFTGLFVGFQPPIGAGDATGGSCAAPAGKHKLGSTIPVKFGLGKCDGNSGQPGIHSLWLRQCDGNENNNNDLIPAVSTDKHAIGNFFRQTGKDFHFNLSTKNTPGLSKGVWEIIAILYEGSSESSKHSVFVELK
jgi:hypothetical protein